VHLDFVVEDLETALADPFGNGFCLVEFSERGYDAIALT
jgi:hypothetical protein